MNDITKNIKVFWCEGKSDGELFERAAEVRKRVFCDEQGYTLEQEMDEVDAFAHHIIVEAGGEAAATGRIFFGGKEDEKTHTMTMGRIAVLSRFRGLNLGRLVMDEMEKRAAELGAAALKLSSQCRVSGFYEKCGFSPLGETYMDGHVLHQMMKKEL